MNVGAVNRFYLSIIYEWCSYHHEIKRTSRKDKWAYGSKKKDNLSHIELNAAVLCYDVKMNIDSIFHSIIYMNQRYFKRGITLVLSNPVTCIKLYLVFVILHSHRLSERFQFSDTKLLISKESMKRTLRVLWKDMLRLINSKLRKSQLHA